MLMSPWRSMLRCIAIAAFNLPNNVFTAATRPPGNSRSNEKNGNPWTQLIYTARENFYYDKYLFLTDRNSGPPGQSWFTSRARNFISRNSISNPTEECLIVRRTISASRFFPPFSSCFPATTRPFRNHAIMTPKIFARDGGQETGKSALSTVKKPTVHFPDSCLATALPFIRFFAALFIVVCDDLFVPPPCFALLLQRGCVFSDFSKAVDIYRWKGVILSPPSLVSGLSYGRHDNIIVK